MSHPEAAMVQEQSEFGHWQQCAYMPFDSEMWTALWQCTMTMRKPNFWVESYAWHLHSPKFYCLQHGLINWVRSGEDEGLPLSAPTEVASFGQQLSTAPMLDCKLIKIKLFWLKFFVQIKFCFFNRFVNPSCVRTSARVCRQKHASSHTGKSCASD